MIEYVGMFLISNNELANFRAIFDVSLSAIDIMLKLRQNPIVMNSMAPICELDIDKLSSMGKIIKSKIDDIDKILRPEI